MLNRLPIKLKLAIAVSIPVIALLIFAGAGLGTLSAVRIGGDNYNRIIDGKDVVADILPPPLYLVEAFLTVEQLARVDSRTEQELLRTRLTQLFAEYEDRHAYWLENLDASSGEEAELRRALTQDAYAPGAQFVEVVRTRFLPAVERGLVTGDMSEPRALADGELESLYEQHRAYIDQVVPLAELRVAKVETSTRDQVRNNLVLLGLTLAAVIAVAVTIAASMARAIVRPITQLRRAVNDVAEVLTDVDLDADAPALARVELDSSQELTEAASSFNTLIDTTGELLARQARSRRNLGEVFQNLGRRNQGMLNRSLSLITKLERNQRDAAVLEDLFRLDHLATRMRRNAENLLVLAGSGSARPAARPAQIGDVVRGALSEIEEFTKVARPDLEPIGVKASAVADLTHLVAELVENASSFSPPDTQVQVRGGRENGGYLLSIIDEGLGMKADALERANERIERMARLDLAPTATLGLYVVGRLAERHGISVRLTEGPLRGVVAKVFIPDVLLLDAAGLDAGDPAARPAQAPLGAAAAGPEPEAPQAGRGDRRGAESPAPSANRRDARPTGEEKPPARLTVEESAAPAAGPALAAAPAEPPATPGAISDEVLAAAGATRPRLAKPAEPAADAATAPAEAEERNGLRRRVKGAQMPKTELRPARTDGPDRPEDAARDRDRLSGFQSGVRRAEQQVRQGNAQDHE